MTEGYLITVMFWIIILAIAWVYLLVNRIADLRELINSQERQIKELREKYESAEARLLVKESVIMTKDQRLKKINDALIELVKF